MGTTLCRAGTTTMGRGDRGGAGPRMDPSWFTVRVAGAAAGTPVMVGVNSAAGDPAVAVVTGLVNLYSKGQR
jgi:hypothetical protein